MDEAGKMFKSLFFFVETETSKLEEKKNSLV